MNSIIDDVILGQSCSGHGPPILFTNAEIRKMLSLARANENDVLVDLGCGWAQNLIIAATEFNVKNCYGIERLRRRYSKAKQRVRQRSLSDRITILEGQFEDFVDGNFKEAKIDDATVIIYALETDRDIIDQLSRKIKEECRLVYYFNGLFPEIKADAIDGSDKSSGYDTGTTTSHLCQNVCITRQVISALIFLVY